MEKIEKTEKDKRMEMEEKKTNRQGCERKKKRNRENCRRKW